MKKYWKVIVVLSIFVILYLAGTAIKHSKSDSNNQSSPAEDDSIDVNEWMEENLPPWLSNFPRAKAELDPDTFTIAGGKTREIKIKASEEEDYRDATFNFKIEGCRNLEDCPDTSDRNSCCPDFKLEIKYRASRAEKGDKDLKEQQWPTERKGNETEASFTILKSKGVITFDNSKSEKPVIVKQKK